MNDRLDLGMWLLPAAVALALAPSCAATDDVVAQTDPPGPGAVSPGYNQLVPAAALRYECDVSLPVEIATTITLRR